MRFLGKRIATVLVERTNWPKGTGFALLRREVVWSKEWRVEFKEYDFTRNPVKNHVFFLESKCASSTAFVAVNHFWRLDYPPVMR